MKLLLTGAAGFIGAHCVRYFTDQGLEVVATDIRAGKGVLPLDVSDSSAVRSMISEVRPQAILHMAALASVPECESNPAVCWKTNLQGTVNVAKESGPVGARIVFFSSAAVYGLPPVLPTPVSTRLAPINLYGLSKGAGELAVRGYAADHVVLRLFNIYGEGCARSYVIPDMVQKLRNAKGDLLLQGTGNESRDFLYISDLLRLIEKALSVPAGSVFNAGSGKTITIRDLALNVARLADRPDQVFRFAGPRLGDFPINFADISPGNVPPGWSPEVPLDEGLRRMIREHDQMG
ncbi:MAG: NAD(P)-dependent oxidoreductase [Thermoplasmata archaeon]